MYYEYKYLHTRLYYKRKLVMIRAVHYLSLRFLRYLMFLKQIKVCMNKCFNV